jgi:hypothetical protein
MSVKKITLLAILTAFVTATLTTVFVTAILTFGNKEELLSQSTEESSATTDSLTNESLMLIQNTVWVEIDSIDFIRELAFDNDSNFYLLLYRTGDDYYQVKLGTYRVLDSEIHLDFKRWYNSADNVYYDDIDSDVFFIKDDLIKTFDSEYADRFIRGEACGKWSFGDEPQTAKQPSLENPNINQPQQQQPNQPSVPTVDNECLDCGRERVIGSNYCIHHKCEECDNRVSQKSLSSHCVEHECMQHSCTFRKSFSRSNYCMRHTCSSSRCNGALAENNYCPEHKCARSNCSIEKNSDSSLFCSNHECNRSGCTNESTTGGWCSNSCKP